MILINLKIFHFNFDNIYPMFYAHFSMQNFLSVKGGSILSELGASIPIKHSPSSYDILYHNQELLFIMVIVDRS